MPRHGDTDDVLERRGASVRERAMWRAAPTVRSAEGWASRLSRWRVRRSGPGGRGGQQKGRAADEVDLGRKIRGQHRDDKEREVHAYRDRVGHLWVAVLLGIVRGFDFVADV